MTVLFALLNALHKNPMAPACTPISLMQKQTNKKSSIEITNLQRYCNSLQAVGKVIDRSLYMVLRQPGPNLLCSVLLQPLSWGHH